MKYLYYFLLDKLMYSIKVLSFKKCVREETLLESRLLYKKNAHLTQIHVCTLFMFNYIQLQIVKNIHDMSNLILIFIYKILCFHINRP